MNMKLSSLKGPSFVKYGDRPNPTRDWLVLISVVAVLLLASLAWNVWLFARVTSGAAIGSESVSAPLNSASSASVTELFKKRAEIETEYKNTRFVDPSVLGV